MYVRMYVCIYIYMFMHTHAHTHIERERCTSFTTAALVSAAFPAAQAECRPGGRAFARAPVKKQPRRV